MPTAFKDQFFNTEFIQQLASHIQDHYYQFNKTDFFLAVLDENWADLELKKRMRHITQQLHKFLPDDYPQAIEILMKVVERTHGPGNMVFPDFVEMYGLEHWELSMHALEKFTQFGSSEFGIRPFIIKDKERTMYQMLSWSIHKNEHIRRLSSEGCRPRLPWAMALPDFKKDPSLILPILENLKHDTSDYVRKSVANNLNDISKDHPSLVFEIGKKWFGKTEKTDRLVKHALRTLLKAGNTEALMLFGFGDPVFVEVNALKTSPAKLKIGEDTTLSFIVNNKDEVALKLRLEYRVHYIKKNGKASPKIFQISEKHFAQGETEVRKKHSFIERTTRKHYAGEHRIELIVNGVSKAETTITVE